MRGHFIQSRVEFSHPTVLCIQCCVRVTKQVSTVLPEMTRIFYLYQIKFSVIKTYARSASLFWTFFAFCGMAVYVGGQVGSNVWLSKWSNDVLLPNNTAEELVAERLGVYAVLGFVQGTSKSLSVRASLH